MMTLHPISAGSGIDYLLRTAASGDVEIKDRDLSAYWSSGGDTPGEWIGRQAGELGLIGEVTQETADAIFKDGVRPDGRPLGRSWPRYPTADEHYERALKREPNATEARREQLRAEADSAGNRTARAGWETVLSPVKSWSILWGTADDDTRAQLEEAEQAAFDKIWARIENEAAWTRIGAQGAAQVQVNRGLMGAAFVHRSSRAGDPDWHRHVAISAKVQHSDGRWLALDARPLHALTVALSEQYTTELEREMYERFGIAADVRGDSVRPDKRPVREYLAVPAEIVHLFSQRRTQTERALADLLTEFREREGREPSRPEQYAMAQAAALTGRPDKEHADSVEAERQSWRDRARAAGFDHPEDWIDQAQVATAERADGPQLVPLEDVVELAVGQLEQQRETWTRANVEAETFRQLTATGWHLALLGPQFDDVVRQLVDAAISPENCELISPPEPHTVPSQYLRRDGTSVFVQHGSARYTSHRLLQWENDLVTSAVDQADVAALAPEQIDAVIAAGDVERGFTPSDEQRAAVQRVFTGQERTHAMIGRAGTGKTTIMRLVKEVADAHQIPVLGLAGGQVQADNLADAAGIRTENIARWLTKSGLGRDTDQWTLAPGTIVIVDEAGQASTPHLHAILDQVNAAGGRLLPIGDPRQLGSPGVGGALALIEARTDVTYLNEVRRFRSTGGALRQWEIDAANAIVEGDAQASWEAYDARGRIHSGPQDRMVDAAYRGWLADVNDGLASVLIAPTNAVAAELSERARADRVVAGIVDDRNTVTLRTGAQAGAGDQIVTRLNARDVCCEDTRQWVRNGDVWTVLEVGAEGTLTVEHALTGGVTELPAAYVREAVELGYAMTKDRAQGINVDTGHALLSIGMAANGAYPALTRGSLMNTAYVSTDAGIDAETGEPGRPLTGRQAWAKIVSRDGAQLSATAQREQAWDAIESLRTLTPRLRVVLADVADAQAQHAVTELLGAELGEKVTSAPAWPALRALLTDLADAGLDTDQIVLSASDARKWDGKIKDYAAILHSRISTVVEDGDLPVMSAGQRPSTAPQPEVEPDPTAADILDRLGLRLPIQTRGPVSDESHDEISAYAVELSHSLQTRATDLGEHAQADAEIGRGWAAAYGPEPVTVAEAVAWRDQLSAAAAYRDYSDYTGRDAVGPAPTDEDSLARSLWRAAQMSPDASTAYREALTLARSAEATWMDAIGTPPAPGDPARAAWSNAVTTVSAYRQRWEHGHETAAIGEQPTEPIQARDWAEARRSLDTWRWVKTTPQLAELDGERLDQVIAQGNAGQVAAEEAAAATAAHRAASQRQIAAEQAAEDAANRAAAARQALQPSGTESEHGEGGARLATLDDQAQRAAEEAEQARQMTAATQARLTETAPDALSGREQMRAATQARQQVAHRLSAAGDWQQRPHGALTDQEVIEAAAVTDAQARQLTTAVPAPALGAAVQAETAQAQADEAALQEQLAQHAARLRAELRLREQMSPERRGRENDERQVTRTRSSNRARTGKTPSTTQDRLSRAYDRSDPTQPQRGPRPDASTRQRREPAQPDRPDRRRRTPDQQPPSRNQAEARLIAAQQDTTDPEALTRARNRPTATPSTEPTRKPERHRGQKPSDRKPAPRPQDQPKKQAPKKTPKKKPPRTTEQRLTGAYERDQDPQRSRNRPPQPPSRDRGGPRL